MGKRLQAVTAHTLCALLASSMGFGCDPQIRQLNVGSSDNGNGNGAAGDDESPDQDNNTCEEGVIRVSTVQSTTDSESDSIDTSCDPAVAAAQLDCNDEDVTRALTILRAMSLEEKVQQMSGPPSNSSDMFHQEDNDRLGVPGFLYMDGPRGVRWYNTQYGTTVYPVAASRASSWNLQLEEDIGRASADEMRYLGRHILLAPTVNQVMHPRWGRAQETYGEDTVLLGDMGVAFIRGAQYDPSETGSDDYQIHACVKHFAANNIEDTRIYVNAELDERTLREVYLPHFKEAIDEDVSCVMGAYNRINGDYSCYSTELIRDILKKEWGYHGYVITDWFAKGNTITSPAAGLDIEMPYSSGTFPSLFDSAFFYGDSLVSAVQNGSVNEALVNEAALRILYQKVKTGLLDHDPVFIPNATKSAQTRELALEAARQGTVLLKNGPAETLDDDILPLTASSLSKVAVVGKFANAENMGDKGSSDAKVVDSTQVFTPYEGIADYLSANGGAETLTMEQITADNRAELADADLIVVVGAYYFADLIRSPSGEEGEWKDRESLELPDRDLENIQAAIELKEQNPDLKIIVQLKSGGAVRVENWHDDVDAIITTWFGGMNEGVALAEILFGDVNPSGKTCQSFPKNEADLPVFENKTTETVEYNYYHGYRWLDREGIEPRYHFGYGLSYTTYGYENLTLSNDSLAASDTISVSVDVTNTGEVTGSEVVQLYVGYSNTALDDEWGRPVKDLKAFARAEDIEPGETRTVTLELPVTDLQYWDPDRDE